tara:strand:+ start:190 stop:723 length:534 start_codon:yes stop_codon:yes gene_type:complete
MIYEQENIGKFKFKRVFNENVDSNELTWHRDYNDRKVFVESSNGWMLQMDEELPKVLNEGQTYVIPKMVYHRVIKGTGDLKITVDEGYNQYRVPKVVKETIRKNLYNIKKSGINMIIPNMLMESKYVSIEVLEEIKKFCDGKSQITESSSPKNNQDKMTYLSYGGLKSYEWVITSLL